MTAFKFQEPSEQYSTPSYHSTTMHQGMGEVTARYNQNHQLISYEVNQQVMCHQLYDDNSRLIQREQKDHQVRQSYTHTGQLDKKIIKNQKETIVYQYEYDEQGREVSRIGSDKTRRYMIYLGEVKWVALCNEWEKWRYRLESLDGKVLEMYYPS